MKNFKPVSRRRTKINAPSCQNNNGTKTLNTCQLREVVTAIDKSQLNSAVAQLQPIFIVSKIEQRIDNKIPITEHLFCNTVEA